MSTPTTTIWFWFLLFLVSTQYEVTLTSALIPSTPSEQTSRAIQSLKNIISSTADGGTTSRRRLYVDYLIPIPPEKGGDGDGDPWPGGLAQMYPYAEKILIDIMRGLVDEPSSKKECTGQIISQQDCCGFFVQESATSSRNDVAAILFPGVEQLRSIKEIDSMVGDDRTLILFNKQFQRPSDFGILPGGFGGGGRDCERIVFDRFQWGFAFQELACRGEDVKFTFEYPIGWQSCVLCDDDGENTKPGQMKEIELLKPSMTRPDYQDVERRINEVLPEPLWMRKLGQAEKKGLRFQRGNEQ